VLRSRRVIAILERAIDLRMLAAPTWESARWDMSTRRRIELSNDKFSYPAKALAGP
jgi:hypothetical protein